jgi:hypothetical protein
MNIKQLCLQAQSETPAVDLHRAAQLRVHTTSEDELGTVTGLGV